MSCRYRGRKFPLTEVINNDRTAAKARSAQVLAMVLSNQ